MTENIYTTATAYFPASPEDTEFTARHVQIFDYEMYADTESTVFEVLAQAGFPFDEPCFVRNRVNSNYHQYDPKTQKLTPANHITFFYSR